MKRKMIMTVCAALLTPPVVGDFVFTGVPNDAPNGLNNVFTKHVDVL